MAQITFNINDAHVQRILAAFSSQFNYQETIDGNPNPENKSQFVKRKLKEYIASVVIGYEAEQEAISARDTKLADKQTIADAIT